MPLSGRIAVITGASAGIGHAIARDLAVAGANIVMNARRAEPLYALCDELNAGDAPVRAAVLPGDASDQATITRLLDTARERFGRDPDIAVVNAGRGLSGSILTSDPAHWEEMVRLNVLGAARLMRAAAERMLAMVSDAEIAHGGWKDRPRDIVVIGSNVGRHISPFSSMYGSTKFAVGSLAEAMRRELAPKGIRVTLIAPGIVKSEFQEVAGYDPQTFGTFMDKVGPVLEPEDVARAVTFILAQPAQVHLNDVAIRPTRQDYP